MTHTTHTHTHLRRASNAVPAPRKQRREEKKSRNFYPTSHIRSKCYFSWNENETKFNAIYVGKCGEEKQTIDDTEESWSRANYANKKLHLMHHKSPRKTCDLLARKKSEKSLAQTHTNRYVLQEVDIIIMKFIIQSIRPIWRNRKTFPYCQCHYIDADLHYYDQATSWMSRHMHSTCVEIIAVAIISLNDKREREPSVRDVVRSLLFFSVAFFGSFKCFFFENVVCTTKSRDQTRPAFV